MEQFRTFCAGVWGERIDCYLTDSVTFRKQIGFFDEHERFLAKLHGDKVTAYNFRATFFQDTIATKTFAREELWKFHQSDTDCRKESPIFGENPIQCDGNFHHFYTYKTKDGNYEETEQFHCGSQFFNAFFYTDSLHFRILVGVSDPGGRDFIEDQNHNGFNFYHVTTRAIIDTVKVETYSLLDLKKGRLIKVCK